MLLQFKDYLELIPSQTGDKPIKNEIYFDEQSERKSVLSLLGLDPSLSDEELEGYKTAFAPSFSAILDEDIPEYSVLEYLNMELEAKKNEIDLINEQFQQNYETALEIWDKGTEMKKTIQLPHDEKAATELISQVESSPNFIKWLGDHEINEIDPAIGESYKVGEFNLSAYKVGDKYVLHPANKKALAEAELKILCEENDLTFEEVDINDVPIDGDNVLTIYQFYQYIDSGRENTQETILEKVIDEEETERENKTLVPNSENLPFFASKTRVEMFDGDDIFDQLNNL